ncbi:aminoglycoside phosphotransferase family protein [Streptomyces gilvus]|uniref:aminoglycoside phosphotransferase family protein n=1 Tax=Streptomyces gilvus TaxID=2920937 RepID=UPI001F0F4F60|nr:aminoglycoside phosphotransferase family protein [Streptomyces sp. CME 23]MCH5677656.1 aminoglycoside phosphotransferase family protein [Streptomyces sp. CME 23]
MSEEGRTEAEVPLAGGRITPGVVRVGDTVRRPVGASSAFVAELLGHLADAGFAGAPRHLGLDAAGRDVLSYLPGWVPARFQHWTDAQVAAAGALLRALHDATRACRLAGGHPVVCHNDPGPNNTVFRNGPDGAPVAFIDFDTAAPGDPLEDLGYMAWTWCVSSKREASPVAAQAAQVRVLADAYGLGPDARPRLVDAIIERQSRNARWWAASRLAPPAVIAERVTWSEREHAFTAAHHGSFAAALR